jgi:hypothetical protein
MQRSCRRLASFLAPTIVLSLAVLPACTSGGTRPMRDGDVGSDARFVDGCDASVDSDGDGIADVAEGMFDQDMDGTPNHLDDDSDGDGLLDADEHMSGHPCTRTDADADGVPNWLDTDSDNDGLPDAEERGTFGTDPYARDTDGDGVTDLGEARGTMTDPTDPTSTIPPGDFFVVLPYGGPHEERTLRFGTEINQADVYFLIDTTGSMGGPIANVQSSLTRIASEIGMRIRDVQMGVGHFEDFPNGGSCSPFDITCLSGSYGSAGDVAYANTQDITADVSSVQTALNALALGNGADGPESQIEAIYQTATGEGGTWAFASGSHAIAPRACPAIPDEPAARRGYPCFRSGSLPIVVLVSDVVFHNGPTGMNAYAGISPPPHTFMQTVTAMNAIGARFVGVAVNGGGRTDQEAMARMTGSVDGSGGPLVYDAAGGAVSDAIIEGISALIGGTPQDVTTTTENVEGNPGGVDARGFIKAIVPVEGYRDGVPGPNPGVSYTSLDTTTFYGVVPGTLVDFEVDFHNDFVPPPVTSQIYRAVIVVIGNGVARLDERQVYIVVPPEGAVVLI